MANKNITGTKPDIQTPTNIPMVRIKGQWIQESLFNRVRTQVANRLPLLKRDVAYTAKKLCGGLFWNLLSSGDQKMAGHCVSVMVNKGELQLQKTDRTPENALQYRLT